MKEKTIILNVAAALLVSLKLWKITARYIRLDEPTLQGIKDPIVWIWLLIIIGLATLFYMLARGLNDPRRPFLPAIPLVIMWGIVAGYVGIMLIKAYT